MSTSKLVSDAIRRMQAKERMIGTTLPKMFPVGNPQFVSNEMELTRLLSLVGQQTPKELVEKAHIAAGCPSRGT